MKYLAAIFLSAAVFGAFLSWSGYSANHMLATRQGAENAFPDPFADITLSARAAYVLDLTTGTTLFAKDAEAQFPLASLAKVMTALVAREHARPDNIVLVDKNALAAEGDSGLLRDEQWTFQDLADFTLMTSSNDGARALASAAAFTTLPAASSSVSFVDLMNQKARALGLTQTFFLNETGLDENASTSGAYGSAKDVAGLFAYVLRTYPELFRATSESEGYFRSFDARHAATNTNLIAGEIPGLVASKTGFTDLAGGNLAIAFEAGPLRPIIVVVLGSTEEGRFQDVSTLVDTAIKAVAAIK